MKPWKHDDGRWLRRSLGCWAPRERPPVGEWLERYVRLPPDRIPWSPASYPHLHAPGGPIEAFARSDVRAVWLQFGSRLGKTALGLALMQYQAAIDPCPMLFGSATEALARRIVTTKIYPSLEMNPELSGQLRVPGRRRVTLISLRHCRIHVAWGGSASQLADLSARFGHANEIDKWTAFSGSEADPFQLFRERLKEFPTRKLFAESTPSLAGKSRIERGLAGSTSRTYWVPCPFCGEFQTLEFGDVSTPWGVKWQKGAVDLETIKQTAVYRCRACTEAVADEYRPRMMRAGIWVPEGQIATKEGTLDGEPLRMGEEEGFQLGSLSALNLSWGDAAAEFHRSKASAPLLQNFRNSWEGKAWTEHYGQTTEDELADRICGVRPTGVVPDEAIFTTIGVDVQREFLVYVVAAFGLEAKGWVVEWGTTANLSTLLLAVLQANRANASKTLRHKPVLTLIDSGDQTDRIYDFCRGRAGKQPPILPCKGAESWVNSAYKVHEMKNNGQKLVLVNTNFFQMATQRAFDQLRPGDPGSIELPAAAKYDRDFLSQLLNEAPLDKPDSRNYTRRVWVKKHVDAPNDFRDAWRYARCAAELWVRSGWMRLTAGHRRLATEPLSASAATTIITPAAYTPPPPQPRAEAPASPPALPPLPPQHPRQSPGGFRGPSGRPFLSPNRRR